MENFKDLNKLYGYLKPSDVSDADPSTPVRQRSLDEIIEHTMFNPRGNFMLWSDIKSAIDTHFSKSGGDYKKLFGLDFHAIGRDSTIDFNDSGYWGKGDKGIKTISDIAPSLNRKDLAAHDCKVSAFITRDPMKSPATRGVDQVEIFLNYIPSIFASQMVPYLDVEFEFVRPFYADKKTSNNPSQSTPSLMRFLLGSVPYSSLAQNDKTLVEADYRIVETGSGKQKNSIPHSFSGMEMFLAPQTLTNMESLGPDSNQRLVQAKPFVPMASIEGFDVTIQNAGAGAFAHKKGNLKLKLHDKARISEFAEFIKGGPGFNSALIWTTYGWLAPRGRGDDDTYAKFINDNMLVRDCWQVINSQFTFDAAGQVSFTLDMVSKATRILQSLTVDRGAGAEDLRAAYANLEELLISIQRIKEKLEGVPKFTIDVSSQQVLNAAAASGNIGNIKDVDAVVKRLLDTIRKSSNPVLKDDELKALEKNLNNLTRGGDVNPYDNVKRKVASYVSSKLKSVAAAGGGRDPFLPSPDAAGDNGLYFPDPDLKDNIKKFKESRLSKIQDALTKANADAAAAKPKGDILDNYNLTKNEGVVSFGKLFLELVAPGIVGSRTCNELQIFFYGLNDECGPVSNLSIAEFPIDMTALAYAYSEALKSTNTDVLTLEQFLKIIVNTQFADIRAIGYGMTELYKVGTPGSLTSEREEGAPFDDKYSKWIQKYGSFKPPMIEFIVESGDLGGSPKDIAASLRKTALQYGEETTAVASGEKKIVKRIHIYDKQCNPYRFAQQYIDPSDGNNSLERGFLDKGRVEAVLGERFRGLDKKKFEDIRNALRGLQNLQQVNAELEKFGIGSLSETDLNQIIRRPGRNSWKMHKDRKSFKDELQRYVPTITVGTNSSMILSANAASKTDGLMGSINIMNSLKGNDASKPGPPASGLEDAGGLPLRVVPMGLTMTTMGCPIASLYQEYFVDFNTGTTIDNLYKCNTLSHTISQGKFTTSWGFIYSNGYGKFGAAPTKGAILVGAVNNILSDIEKAAPQKPKGK